MSWLIEVQEPSGETHQHVLQGVMRLGKSSQLEIPLRDFSLDELVGTITEDTAIESPQLSPFWIKIESKKNICKLGDLELKEAKIPCDMKFQIGETFFRIIKKMKKVSLPIYPLNVRPWLTVSEEGRQLLWMAKKAAETPLSIYLAGETGTGKEVIAHMIHAWSDRKSGPFIPVHCGALPLSLAESELFGHVKGSFTGASHHRPGAFMQAHRGTLFLDEIGDLPLDIQVKLLRFLENGEIRAVGSDRFSHSDVRIICATHQPLLKLVEEGKFRSDLYYRIASITLNLPSLRSRTDDIEFLSLHFAKEMKKTLLPKALHHLKAYSWPGNVRELRHAIERASGLAGAFKNLLDDESFEFLNHSQKQKLDTEENFSGLLTLKEMEKLLLIRALRVSHGNRVQSAKILGVARSTLFEMLKRHRIMGPRSFYYKEEVSKDKKTLFAY